MKTIYVKDLSGILYGNVLFRKFNEDIEEFEILYQFSSYNLEERPEFLLEMKVVGIYLADIGEYDGEKCDSEKGILIVEVE